MSQLRTITLTLLLVAYITCFDREYILNSPKCKIPNISPFSVELVNIMQSNNYTPCNRTELLSHVTKYPNGLAVLHLREDLVPQYTSGEIECWYSYVSRNGTWDLPDEGISFSEYRRIYDKIFLKHDTVKIICKDHNQDLIYENVHNVVTKDSVKKKIKSYHNGSKPFSVLFVVVDSLSRLNFIRTMHQTYTFLEENNFIEMKGYTKVADNTYPNCMALLTGFNPSRADAVCTPYVLNGLDNCPMVWYDYRKKGYITAYAEDFAPISTFNFCKKGFTEPPTDYYFKPYVEASETLKTVWKYHMPYCTGPESAGERILNLAKDFATTFQNQSTFGVFWMNTFSHNDVNAPYSMDEKLKQFFIDIKKAGVFEESFVFFLSDHGIRFGNIRGTQTGWFEERMPVNMISVPKNFQERFRTEYENLKENSNKLTNTYDMYMTLQDILTLSGISHEVKPSWACPSCVSLFRKVPTDRSCNEAAIPEEWCTCIGHFQTIDKNHEYVKNATAIALKKIMEKVDRTRCVDYHLEGILASSVSQSIGSDKKTKYLYINLETAPLATFYVTVKFRESVTSSSIFYIRRLNNIGFCTHLQ